MSVYIVYIYVHILYILYVVYASDWGFINIHEAALASIFTLMKTGSVPYSLAVTSPTSSPTPHPRSTLSHSVPLLLCTVPTTAVCVFTPVYLSNCPALCIHHVRVCPPHPALMKCSPCLSTCPSTPQLNKHWKWYLHFCCCCTSHPPFLTSSSSSSSHPHHLKTWFILFASYIFIYHRAAVINHD